MRLQGKVAIVTGGASGFGEGIAQTFTREGASVIVNDIQAELGQSVVAAIEENGGTAKFVEADIATDTGMAALLAATVETYGRLDVMVANAGVTHSAQPLSEVSEAEFDRVFNVNVKGIYHAAKHSIPLFQSQGTGGSFIITASTAGLRPRPGLVWYAASKGAAISIAKAMAIELAADNIRVNAICPVAGDTPLLPQFLGGDSDELRQRTIRSIPLGRLSTPDDVANAALYLASDEGSFITGTAMEVDGGRCI